MARPADPNSRRATIAAKISDADLAAIDTARGHLSRSAWIAAAIREKLGTPAPESSPPTPAKPVRTRAAKPQRAATTAVPVSQCPHRGLKAGAWCRTCDSTVPGKQG